MVLTFYVTAQFLLHDAMDSAVYAVVRYPSLRLHVRLSVTFVYSVVSKRINVSSKFFIIG